MVFSGVATVPILTVEFRKSYIFSFKRTVICFGSFPPDGQNNNYFRPCQPCKFLSLITYFHRVKAVFYPKLIAVSSNMCFLCHANPCHAMPALSVLLSAAE